MGCREPSPQPELPAAPSRLLLDWNPREDAAVLGVRRMDGGLSQSAGSCVDLPLRSVSP